MTPFHPRAALAFILTLVAGGCAGTGSQVSGPDRMVYADYLSGRYADLQRDSGTATTRYFSALLAQPRNTTIVDGAVNSALISGDRLRAEAAANVARRSGMDSDLGRLTLAAIALREGRYGVTNRPGGNTQEGAFDRLATRLFDSWALVGSKQIDAGADMLVQVGGGALFKPMFDYERAMMFDLAGRNAEAIALYESAEAAGIRLTPGLIRHGRLLERTGERDKALALYRTHLSKGEDPVVVAELRRVESGQPDNNAPITPAEGAASGLYALSSTLVGQADPEFYLPYLTLTEILDPGLHVATMLRSEGLRQMKQFAAARAELAEVPTSSPWYEAAQTRVAWTLNEEGKPREALTVARANAQRDKGRSARTNLADMERANENYAAAEALYDGLIQEIETPVAADWALYFARGASRGEIGRVAEGEADLKKALELSPNQATVLNYLGYSWVDRGMNLPEGLEMLRKAVSLEPKSGAVLDSLGWAYYRLGDYDSALEALERALELEPEDPTLNDHLGDLYWRLNRKVEAGYQWSRALSLKPKASDQLKIEAKLKDGLPNPAPDAQTVRNAPR